jgi:hypothetical protein
VTTTLSNRGYPMLRAFVDRGAGYHMSIEEAQAYDQRPFRSALIRGYIKYVPRKGFQLTREGRAAWADFHNTNIGRVDPSRPLTSYFDPIAYGLDVRERGEHAATHRHPHPRRAQHHGAAA